VKQEEQSQTGSAGEIKDIDIPNIDPIPALTVVNAVLWYADTKPEIFSVDAGEESGNLTGP
jgi:hypothetical protein